MTTIKISEKGQITLPATVRRRLRLEPRSSVSVEVRDDEIVLRPVRPISELKGIFHAYAGRRGASWESERRHMEKAVAEEVESE
jgi:AbrB family looped-hinge helix DNA binding protein